MSGTPRKRSRIRRFLRWWGDAISHAGVTVGASRAFSGQRDPSGSDKYTGTALLLERARHADDDPRSDAPEDDA